MIKQLNTSIIINAKPEKVWNVLMDFEKYPEWNSFITFITGNQKKGNVLKVKLQDMIFKPKIISLDENREFKWLGHLLFKGVFDGEHQFKLIENNDGTTTFYQNENFKGVLVRFFSKSLDNKTKKGFEMMNRELKLRVEIM